MRRYCEAALGRETAGSRHDAGGSLVLAAAVTHQDDGAGPGGGPAIHSTPGISPEGEVRVNSCSRTPPDDVSEMKRIAF